MRILLLAFLLFFQLRAYGLEQVNQAITPEASDPYVWDFGRVNEGGLYEHNFILKNDSKDVLTVKDATTSCGCAVSKIEKKVLSPGESTNLEVKFNSKGYSGKVQQFIYVNTDNVDNPVLKFIIKAEVE